MDQAAAHGCPLSEVARLAAVVGGCLRRREEDAVTEQVDPTVEVEPEEVPQAEVPAEVSLEVPEADAVEQARPAVAVPADPGLPDDIAMDADPADLAEQAREVDLDEDEYR